MNVLKVYTNVMLFILRVETSAYTQYTILVIKTATSTNHCRRLFEGAT
jgi:hypothetical protein